MSDTNNQPITEEERKKVYDILAELLLKGLDLGNPDVFDVKDSEDSAEFIASKLDLVKTRGELLEFLKQLSEQWDVYRAAYVDMQKEDLMRKVQEELSQLKGGS